MNIAGQVSFLFLESMSVLTPIAVKDTEDCPGKEDLGRSERNRKTQIEMGKHNSSDFLN